MQTAVGGKAFTQMIEGEKTFDIALRWPEALRDSVAGDPRHSRSTSPTTRSRPGYVAGTPQTPQTGGSSGVSAVGTSVTMPAKTGSQFGGTLNDLSTDAAAAAGRPGHAAGRRRPARRRRPISSAPAPRRSTASRGTG